MMIFNLTQHTATPDQIEAGVIEPDPETKREIQALLTFEEPPTIEEMANRACQLVELVQTNVETVMIGGAPFFMSTLENMLKQAGMVPVHAFSKRVSEEVSNPDGTVTKRQVFKHAGFVSVPYFYGEV